MNSPALYLAAALLALGALAEWLHGRRCRRLGRLAFGPSGQPRRWVRAAPALRVIALAALGWGLATLWLAPGQSRVRALLPEGGFRRLIIALDVSPSMQLKDAGADRQQVRARRASSVMQSVLERIALDQVRISVVAFYTSAKPVVVDTLDLEVVRNILDDLPLDYAFDPGKTSLVEGIRESVKLAAGWPPGSTTLLVVSDGDTLPDSGLPELPRSIAQVLVLGVGDSQGGTFH